MLGGGYIAGALEHLGADVMARMLMTPAPYSVGGTVVDVVVGPLQALLAVPSAGRRTPISPALTGLGLAGALLPGRATAIPATRSPAASRFAWTRC